VAPTPQLRSEAPWLGKVLEDRVNAVCEAVVHGATMTSRNADDERFYEVEDFKSPGCIGIWF